MARWFDLTTLAALGGTLIAAATALADQALPVDGEVSLRLDENPAQVRGFMRSGRLQRS